LISSGNGLELRLNRALYRRAECRDVGQLISTRQRKLSCAFFGFSSLLFFNPFIDGGALRLSELRERLIVDLQRNSFSVGAKTL